MAQKKQRGRPTVFKPEYCKQAFSHTLIGATDKDLARCFDVSEPTITIWKREHPDFLSSIKAGKEEADAKVAKSLYQRALADDTTAAIFWLKNRRPAQFRQNPEVAVTVENNVTVDTTKPPEDWGAHEIAAELKKLGVNPITSHHNGNGNGNGHDGPVKIKARPA